MKIGPFHLNKQVFLGTTTTWKQPGLFFKNICTTHEYDEDVLTIKVAKEAGLEVCSGGIIGLGEDFSHRLELASLLQELDVDSIPINFF